MASVAFYVWGVFSPADLIMGDPTDADELYSVWKTEDLARLEADRLNKVNGYDFKVSRLDVLELTRTP